MMVSMGKVTRKRYTADFKAQVALEAIKGEKTLAELAAKHGIHQTMIATWKRQAIEGLSSAVSGKAEAVAATKRGRVGVTSLNLALMREIDGVFMDCPFYGARQMMRHLRRLGHPIGRKRAARLMALMGLAPIHQKPRISPPNPQYEVYKSVLRGLEITRPNHV